MIVSLETFRFVQNASVTIQKPEFIENRDLKIPDSQELFTPKILKRLLLYKST